MSSDNGRSFLPFSGTTVSPELDATLLQEAGFYTHPPFTLKKLVAIQFDMSLQNFPKAQLGELLGSVLARCAHQLGLAEDKTVLEVLFGSQHRSISTAPGPYIWQLLSRVGHIWQTSPEQLLQEHSILPVFRPFHRQRPLPVCSTRSDRRAKPTRIISIWYKCFYYPMAHSLSGMSGVLARTKAISVFTYWQRLFQCPGVDCCPTHRCSLVTTTLALQPSRRHHITGALKQAHFRPYRWQHPM